jgi:hypothetical protein
LHSSLDKMYYQPRESSLLVEGLAAPIVGDERGLRLHGISNTFLEALWLEECSTHLVWLGVIGTRTQRAGASDLASCFATACMDTTTPDLFRT